MKDIFTQFEFTGYSVDKNARRVRFIYTVYSDTKTLIFHEDLIFPNFENIPFVITPLVKRILDNVFLMLGISYWKLYCPPNIRIVPFALTPHQRAYWETVYTKGLGEFFYRNSIEYRHLVHFPYNKNLSIKPIESYQSNRSLLLFGGGKDSLVSASLLTEHQKPFVLISLNSYPIQKDVAKGIPVPYITIKRVMDKKLLTLPHVSTAYDGHVPISAIYSWVSMLTASLYDFRYVISSNEASSDYGNLTYLGHEINHQWSKSYEYEQLLQTYMHSFVTTGIIYFSLLRSCTEFHIVKLFSTLQQNFTSFSSCNTNFKKNHNSRTVRWCGVCAKCAFVFLLLAVFVDKKTLVTLFSKNLFDDSRLVPMFRELLGLSGNKPFDCVGTPEESMVSFYHISKNKEYAHDSVIKELKRDCVIDPIQIKKLSLHILTQSKRHSIPLSFVDIIKTL